MRRIASDDAEQPAQDAVLVEALHLVDCVADPPASASARSDRAPLGIQPRRRTARRAPRRPRVADERPLHVRVGVRDAGLAQVAGDRADDRHLRPFSPARSTSAPRPSSSSSPRRMPRNAVLEQLPPRLDLGGGRAGRSRTSTPARGPARRDLVRPLVDHRRAQALERRQHVGQRHRGGAEQLAPDRASPAASGRRARRSAPARGQRLERARCRPPPTPRRARRGTPAGTPPRSARRARRRARALLGDERRAQPLLPARTASASRCSIAGGVQLLGHAVHGSGR